MNAHPVPYLGGTALDSVNQSFVTDSYLSYSFKPRTAIAARVMNLEGRAGFMSYYAPQLNFLVNRWNGDGYQSNFYIMGGVGVMNYEANEHSAILTSADYDAESRRLYFSTKAERMWTGVGSHLLHFQSRVGVAPYLAEFHQVSTWLMVQYDHNSILTDRDKITPLIRMFYRNYLVEAGRSTDGDWLVNFMVHI